MTSEPAGTLPTRNRAETPEKQPRSGPGEQLRAQAERHRQVELHLGRRSGDRPRVEREPARGAQPTPKLAAANSAAIAVPDCDAVALHMRDLELANLERVHKIPEQKRKLISEHLTTKTVNECKREQWSENMRLCIVDADEIDRAEYDCTDSPVATPEEVAALPPELRCEALAQHVIGLATGPDGKYTIAKRKLAAYPDRVAALDKLIDQGRIGMTRECNQMPWSVERRRCYAASKTHQATAACK